MSINKDFCQVNVLPESFTWKFHVGRAHYVTVSLYKCMYIRTAVCGHVDVTLPFKIIASIGALYYAFGTVRIKLCVLYNC